MLKKQLCINLKEDYISMNSTNEINTNMNTVITLCQLYTNTLFFSMTKIGNNVFILIYIPD